MLRHFLNLQDLTIEELREIIAQSILLKKSHKFSKVLEGKYLALIFEKASTRTRVSFESAMTQLGGTTSFLSPNDLQLGRGEPIEDTAKVISSMADAVVLRTFSHKTIETFSEHSNIPVINGLTDLSHPCQLLADLLTFQEIRGDIQGSTVSWIGDTNNVCYSYIEASEMLDFDIRIACPEKYRSDIKSNKKIKFFDNPEEAVVDADLISTDVWVSMGNENQREERYKAFKKFQVTTDLMQLAKPEAIFMHCLPAIRGKEVSEELLLDPRSKVWQQAENRLHAQKALLLFLLNH